MISGRPALVKQVSSDKIDGKVRVVARIRPILPHEPSGTRCAFIKDGVLKLKQPTASQCYDYTFDGMYDESSTQDEIFHREIQPMLDSTFAGVNTTVFAYGNTGAGKTHTMQGTEANPGVIPRVMEKLLHMVHSRGKSSKLMVSADSDQVSVSYLEIYNEKVYDLMDSSENDLPLREDGHKNIIVQGLSEVSLLSYDHFKAVYSMACKNRSVAATRLNSQSSRSHAVMIVKVIHKEDIEPFRVLTGKLHLIDLAGSEDNRKTDNRGARVLESGHINKSLFVLGKVVNALNSKESRIPYRDSKLTRLLQDSLGGKSKAIMIANLAPCVEYYNDTLNTLNFATHSQRIVNEVAIHFEEEQPDTSDDLKMKSKLEEWRLAKGKSGKKSDVFVSAPVEAFVPSKRLAVATGKEGEPAIDRSAITALVQEKVDDLFERKRKESVKSEKSLASSVEQRLEMLEKQVAQKPAVPVKATASSSRVPLTPVSKLTLAGELIKDAKAAEAEGDFEKAIRRYTKARDLVPDNEKIRNRLIKLQTQMIDQAIPDTKYVGRTLSSKIIDMEPPAPKPKRDDSILTKRPLQEVSNVQREGKKVHSGETEMVKPTTKDVRPPTMVSVTMVPGKAMQIPIVGNPALPMARAIDFTREVAMVEAAPTVVISKESMDFFEKDTLATINRGDKKALLKLNTIGAKTAEKIITQRTISPFTTLAELKLVGLTDKKLQKFIDENVVARVQLHAHQQVVSV